MSHAALLSPPAAAAVAASGAGVDYFGAPGEPATGGPARRRDRVPPGGRTPAMLRRGLLPKQCPDAGCGRWFQQQVCVDRHFVAVHQKVRLLCDVCGRRVTPSYLPAHVRKVHVSLSPADAAAAVARARANPTFAFTDGRRDDAVAAGDEDEDEARDVAASPAAPAATAAAAERPPAPGQQ